MEKSEYKLEHFGGSIYLLLRDDEELEHAKLFLRMKKDKQSLAAAYLLFNKLSEFDYEELINLCVYYRVLSKIEGVKGIGELSIQVFEVHIKDPITSRKQIGLWRLLAARKDGVEKLVLIDSFQNHKRKPLNREVADRLSVLKIVDELLKGDAENGT